MSNIAFYLIAHALGVMTHVSGEAADAASDPVELKIVCFADRLSMRDLGSTSVKTRVMRTGTGFSRFL